nr:phosphatidate cytidylyltransferase [Anaerolineae bacterium]
MLKDRLISTVIYGIPVLLAVILGGWWMAGLVFVVGALALIEFSDLLARRDQRGFPVLMVLAMAFFVIDRALPALDIQAPGMAFLMLAVLARSAIMYRAAAPKAVAGFLVSITGIFYVGWVVAHFVSLRGLPDGLYWTLSVVLAVWIADSGAYFLGRAVGRTPLAPHISPKKTLEGYIGGVISGTAISAALPLGWQALGASAAVTPLHGMMLGLLISLFSPLGDLGISMIKRYVGAKDSSNRIPGHGGFLDRLDAQIIAVLAGYYYLIYIVY